MKKYLIIILSSVLLVTGCVRQNINMEINNDKSMNLSVILAVDTEFFNEEDGNVNFSDYKELGLSSEEYIDGTFKGYRYTKKIDSIDKISKSGDVTYELSKLFEEKLEDSTLFSTTSNLFGSNYKAKFTYNSDSLNDMNQTEDGSVDDSLDADVDIDTDTDMDTENMDISNYLTNFDLKYVITLPSKSISNNATTVSEDGRTLTWDLTKSDVSNIEFEFEIKNNIILYAIIGGAALILIIVIAIVINLIKKNKKNKNVEEVVEEVRPSIDEVLTPIVNVNNNVDVVTAEMNNMPSVDTFGVGNIISEPVAPAPVSEPIIENNIISPVTEPVNPVPTEDVITNVEPTNSGFAFEPLNTTEVQNNNSGFTFEPLNKSSIPNNNNFIPIIEGINDKKENNVVGEPINNPDVVDRFVPLQEFTPVQGLEIEIPIIEGVNDVEVEITAEGDNELITSVDYLSDVPPIESVLPKEETIETPVIETPIIEPVPNQVDLVVEPIIEIPSEPVVETKVAEPIIEVPVTEPAVKPVEPIIEIPTEPIIKPVEPEKKEVIMIPEDE